jgi:hypothetical protein
VGRGCKNGYVANIVIGTPTISGGRVTVPIDTGSARPYFTDRELWFDYGRELDLTHVEPAIALLPALGTVIPIALAAGVGVTAPFVDAVFAGQVDSITAVIREMYPTLGNRPFSLEGEVVHGKAEEAGDGAMLLYSGGIDSFTSLIRRRDDVECLVSVWGADVELEDVALWSLVEQVVAGAPAKPGTRRLTVRTNFRSGLDDLRLNRDFDGNFAGTNWWAGIQHGLSLITICAPVSSALGLSRVLVASSFPADIPTPWGSTPLLDNLIRWTGGAGEHDSADLTRQQKVTQVVVPFLAEQPTPLAVCYQVGRGGANANCGECEKCLRTASGILAAGGDPAWASIPATTARLAAWERLLESGNRKLGYGDFLAWEDIQNNVSRDDEVIDATVAGDYLRWLRTFDLVAITKPSTPQPIIGRMPRWRYEAERVAHRLPYGLRRQLRRLVL